MKFTQRLLRLPWTAAGTLVVVGLVGAVSGPAASLTTAPAEAQGLRPIAFHADAPNLRYGWKQGQSYVYAVRIEAEDPDYTETEAGNATYTVRAADEDSMTLTYRGTLFPQQRTREGRIVPGSGLLMLNRFRFGGPGMGAGLFASLNEVKIDPQGKVLSTRGGTTLPRALGDLGRLVIEPLTEEGRTWQADNDCEIVLQEVHRLTPFSHFGRTESTNLPAHEKTVYTLGEAAGDSVQITKHYELKTSETVGGRPRLEMTGDGQITFDVKAGIPRAMEFKVTMVENTDPNTTVRTPITVTYKLLEGAERDRALNPPPAPAMERKPLTDAERMQALADLKSTDHFRRSNAANRLTGAQVDGHRAEVALALEPLLDDQDGFTRQAAIRALAVWATKDSIPLLIKRLDDEDFAVRWAALDALGTLKDPRAAEAVAARLKDDQGPASRALQAIGPAAAPAVAKRLNDPEWTVRLEACRILKVIGTRASLPALDAATHDTNGLIGGAAQEAIKAIDARYPLGHDA